jgi:hypothetical protein
MPWPIALRNMCSKAGTMRSSTLRSSSIEPPIDVELDLLADVLGGLPHHAIQTLGDGLELDHAGAQQVALQLPCLAGLGNQVVFGTLHRALQLRCTVATS